MTLLLYLTNIDGSLTITNTSSQSGPWSNANEVILHIP